MRNGKAYTIRTRSMHSMKIHTIAGHCERNRAQKQNTKHINKQRVTNRTIPLHSPALKKCWVPFLALANDTCSWHSKRGFEGGRKKWTTPIWLLFPFFIHRSHNWLCLEMPGRFPHQRTTAFHYPLSVYAFFPSEVGVGDDNVLRYRCTCHIPKSTSDARHASFFWLLQPLPVENPNVVWVCAVFVLKGGTTRVLLAVPFFLVRKQALPIIIMVTSWTFIRMCHSHRLCLWHLKIPLLPF